MAVTFDMYQTLAIGVGALFLGRHIKKKVYFFERFCIPAPVIGGGIVSILVCVLHVLGFLDVAYDETIKDICMTVFFTTVGYQLDIRTLKSGGRMFPKMLIVIAIIAFAQNGTALLMSTLLNLNPLLGMSVGSIPMIGGHGTSAAFGPVLEEMGLEGATTICTAAATFGLIAGSLIGGPIGDSLIRRKDLTKTARDSDAVPESREETAKERLFELMPSACHLAIAIGVGSVLSYLLSLTGMVFPKYIGGLLTGAVISNIGSFSGKYKVYTEEVNKIGELMLDFFLGIALITIKLWILADLALPLVIMISAQVVFMIIFARFGVFHILGGNYDAAVLTAGVCGFGLGATPNAMANVQAVTQNRPPSRTAFLLIPLIGGLFIDIINSFTILLFLNLIRSGLAFS